MFVVNAPAIESSVSNSEKIVTSSANTAYSGYMDAKNEFWFSVGAKIEPSHFDVRKNDSVKIVTKSIDVTFKMISIDDDCSSNVSSFVAI